MRPYLVSLGLLVVLGGAARADSDAEDGGSAGGSSCRSVSITFRPVKELQIAVWIEDDQGNYVDTAYVTRLTGTFGLANRPGNHYFHSATRFPYGRRDMVLPVWAHKRNHTYGYVVMGGAEGNSMASCTNDPGDCDDNTIAYHPGVSSSEPFYCSPSGGQLSTDPNSGMDVVSCASPFIGSKGAYAGGNMVSYYPPRADLVTFSPRDSNDARAYSSVNDLGIVSGATPQLEQLIDPPISWHPPHDGKYVAKIELSQESDFNASWPNNDPHADDIAEYNSYGKNFLGQPSVVYAVPFTVGDSEDVQVTSAYEGYGDSTGATGIEHLPDNTISDTPGSGAGRLLDSTASGASFRVQVAAEPTCSGTPSATCNAPNPPTNLTLVPHATSFDVSFASATGGEPTTRFDVRYRTTPIGDDDFYSANPSDRTPPPPGSLGSTVSTAIDGLEAQAHYYVGVRAFSSCNGASTVVTKDGETTTQQFVTLHGCFIATAAWGTPMAAELDTLRAVRDRALLTNPLGRLAVASYYALSPPIARAIASDERLRAGARALLRPIVATARAGMAAQGQLHALVGR